MVWRPEFRSCTHVKQLCMCSCNISCLGGRVRKFLGLLGSHPSMPSQKNDNVWHPTFSTAFVERYMHLHTYYIHTYIHTYHNHTHIYIHIPYTYICTWTIPVHIHTKVTQISMSELPHVSFQFFLPPGLWLLITVPHFNYCLSCLLSFVVLFIWATGYI